MQNLLEKRIGAPAASVSQLSMKGRSVVPCKRTTSSRFTQYQLSELSKRFTTDPYIRGIEKELLAKHLGITMTAISNWFHLERMRLKRHLTNEARNATITA